MLVNSTPIYTSTPDSRRWCSFAFSRQEVSMPCDTDTARPGRHRFSISTRFMRDYGFEAPVSGATELVTARGPRGRLEVLSIGTDQRIHHFIRDAAGKWSRLRWPWRASSLAVVPQRDGTDKVFFAELTVGEPAGPAGHEKKTVTVFELEDLVSLEELGAEPRRRLLGRFETTDPKVYGVGPLSGVQCRDGSNILVTALAARPGADMSRWVVLFGHRSSTGALSLSESKGVVARKVLVAGEDPGSTRWPHMTFVLLNGGVPRVEWGMRSGVLLQSEEIPVPELAEVAAIDVVRDHRGYLRIFALDRGHRIHVLAQTGGGDGDAPRFASAWRRLDAARADGSRPSFDRIRALRQRNGDLTLFALDGDDGLWSISEEAGGSSDRWGGLAVIGIRAAHITAASTDDNRLEVFAVSRHNQLLWLRQRERRDGWRLESIGWDASSSEKIKLDVYRTGLTIFDGDYDAVVPGVPVRVTATEKMPSTVNGLTYTIGPDEPVLAETNAFGKLSVTFELTELRPAPALSFEAGSDEELDPFPDSEAHVYAGENREPPEDANRRRSG